MKECEQSAVHRDRLRHECCEGLPCGCRYDGPVQVLSCGEHNAAAKNLNRAQAMLSKLELERDHLKQALENIQALIPHQHCSTCDQVRLLVRDALEKPGS